MEPQDELKQAVLTALDKRGTLPQIRAQLRQEVFLAIDENDRSEGLEGLSARSSNAQLASLQASEDGKLALALVHDFLVHAGLQFTRGVFEPEARTTSGDPAIAAATRLGVTARAGPDRPPLLLQIVRNALHGHGGASDAPVELTAPVEMYSAEETARTPPAPLSPTGRSPRMDLSHGFDDGPIQLLDPVEKYSAAETAAHARSPEAVHAVPAPVVEVGEPAGRRGSSGSEAYSDDDFVAEKEVTSPPVRPTSQQSPAKPQLPPPTLPPLEKRRPLGPLPPLGGAGSPKSDASASVASPGARPLGGSDAVRGDLLAAGLLPASSGSAQRSDGGSEGGSKDAAAPWARASHSNNSDSASSVEEIEESVEELTPSEDGGGGADSPPALERFDGDGAGDDVDDAPPSGDVEGEELLESNLEGTGLSVGGVRYEEGAGGSAAERFSLDEEPLDEYGGGMYEYNYGLSGDGAEFYGFDGGLGESGGNGDDSGLESGDDL
ncbi:unnamed protein product [Pedinophyceae sp. YPF-701]|nr:unnamed protein product [Pedinophyceae sp. YPF-701]